MQKYTKVVATALQTMHSHGPIPQDREPNDLCESGSQSEEVVLADLEHVRPIRSRLTSSFHPNESQVASLNVNHLPKGNIRYFCGFLAYDGRASVDQCCNNIPISPICWNIVDPVPTVGRVTMQSLSFLCTPDGLTAPQLACCSVCLLAS